MKVNIKVKQLSGYTLACILSLAIALLILKVGKLNLLRYPISYEGGDGVFYEMAIKSTLIHGWYITNPTLAAPGTYSLADFPLSDGLFFVIIKIIGFFTTNWALVTNIFFLLSFPLCTLSALFVFQRIGLIYPFALAASILFSFLPYHFLRGTSHLFLASYYTVPLAIWLSYLVYENRISTNKNKSISLLIYSLVCILIGSGGIYYAFFGSFFILLAGLISSMQNRKKSIIGYSLLFISIIFFSIVINILPSLILKFQQGDNLHVAHRGSSESEYYGLKIIQLLLPIEGDRIALLRKISHKYVKTGFLLNENSLASLGLLGSIGLIGLFLSLFRSYVDRTIPRLPSFLAHLNLGGILLATVGGFSSLFALLISPEIRCYNRISVFIGFFALAAFFFLIQQTLKKWPKWENRRTYWYVATLLLAFGIFNQTSSSYSIKDRLLASKKEYKRDAVFFNCITQTLAENSMVFQLPYMPFPEANTHNPHIFDYDHFKAPLHCEKIKWSFGAMPGRSPNEWLKETGSLAVPDMIEQLVYMGFNGIYINRNGYPDQAKELEVQLAHILHIDPIVSNNKSFWNLNSYKQTLKMSQTAQQWEENLLRTKHSLR